MSCIHVIPTVIACRVSPMQKAALVRMVKAAAGRPITLAIGIHYSIISLRTYIHTYIHA